MLSFSVLQNGRRLLTTETPGDTMGCLHGIRFLSMAWVVLGHQYTMGALNALNLLQYQHDMLENWARVYVTSGSLSVDTFFVLSGLLVSYIFLKTVTRTQSFNLPLFYLHRYIRLTPLFAVVILMTPTLFAYIGEGPLWEQSYQSSKEACEQYWWSGLLYVNNYVNPEFQCQGESWFLAVDMQLYWLSPLLLVPLWKWPKRGKQLATLVFIMGIVAAFVVTYVLEIAPTTARETSIDKYKLYMRQYYYATQVRFPPYIAGILLGAILAEMKAKGCKVQLSKLAVLLSWVGVAACLLLPLMLLQPFNTIAYKYNVLDAAFYNGLSRPMWGIGIAGLIFMCVHGYGGWINLFLSWRFFVPLGRLSYCVYFIHETVMFMVSFSVRSPQYAADVMLIPIYFGTIVVSLLVSVVFCTLFEFPFVVLEKELLGNLYNRQRKPAEIPDSKQPEFSKPHSDIESPEVPTTPEETTGNLEKI